MDPLQTNAQIAQITATEGPAFVRENNSSEKAYTYHWINSKNEVGLLSKTYRTAKSRNNAQKQVQEGKYSIEAMSVEGLFTYAAHSHDGQVAAMGPLFADEETRDLQLQELQSATGASPANIAVAEGPDRHSFRIDFYRGSKGSNWQGRISYPLSQEKKSFQQIDMKAIEAFIQKHLKKSRTSAPSDLSPQNVPPLTIVHQGAAMTTAALPTGTTIDVELALEKLAKNKVYEAQVVAKSLENGEQTLVSRQKGKLAVESSLRMKVITEGLPSGLYRLEAEVGVSGAPYKDAVVKRSGLLHLV